MKKDKYFWIVVLIILIGMLIFTATTEIGENEVCFSSDCVKVQIADSQNERSKGLMFVSSLNENEGMLFIFDEQEKYSFWMKDTLIPLDMIWINKDLEVVDIKTAEPCFTEECPAYAPSKKAKYVLEVNAGWAERKEIGVGDFAWINI